MNAIAQRLRMTEGQLYSSIITLVIAALLATGLGGVHGVVSSALSTAPLAPVVEGVAAPVAIPSPAAPELLAPGGIALPLGRPTAVPLPEPAPEPTFDNPAPVTSLPTPSPKPTTPPAGPCAAAPVLAAGTDLLTAVNAIAGGRLPDRDVEAALGVVTGCDPADPAVIAVGLLIGIGEALPDPGVDPPVLPYVELPSPLVAALQPAREQVDTVCGVVGTGQTVASLFVSAYPRPVSPLVTQVLFQALALCGQLRNP